LTVMIASIQPYCAGVAFPSLRHRATTVDPPWSRSCSTGGHSFPFYGRSIPFSIVGSCAWCHGGALGCSCRQRPRRR
jgi:hypothetical protein